MSSQVDHQQIIILALDLTFIIKHNEVADLRIPSGAVEIIT